MRKTTNKTKQSVLVTDLAEFYRCNGEDGERFYPAQQSVKGAAIDYNGGALPPTVRGFAVYDTTVAMDYAIALYGDKAEAEKHKGAPAPKAPETLFESKREVSKAKPSLTSNDEANEDEGESTED